jgi:hypothetical protein
MSNNYFTPVEFSELKEETKEIRQPDLDNDLKGDLPNAFTNVRRIFAAIRTGESDLRRGALQLLGNDPCMRAFSRLEEVPTKTNLVRFLELATQDLGRKAARELLKVFTETDPSLKEDINVRF